jgi:hypothetical protein
MSAAELLADEQLPWIMRAYDPSLDEAGMMSLLSGSYCRSSAGRRAGACGYANHDPAGEAKRREYTQRMRPMWQWLLAHAETRLAVDAEHPDSNIWGWLVTSGPEVIHAVGCKWDVIAAGICHELVFDLLGERWTSRQVVTLELPQMRKGTIVGRGSPGNWFELMRPSNWAFDPMWLPAEMSPR